MDITETPEDLYPYIPNGTDVWVHLNDGGADEGTVTDRMGVGDYCWYYIEFPQNSYHTGWYHYYDTVITPNHDIKITTPCMSCGFFRSRPAPGGCKDTRSHVPLNTPKALDDR